MSVIHWDDTHLAHSLVLKVKFVPPSSIHDSQPTRRLLPCIDYHRTKLIALEGDGQCWFNDGVSATPDAVLQYQGGLIALEYKTRQSRQDVLPTLENWSSFIHLAECLQVVIAAYNIAQTYQVTTASVLRFDNAIVLVTPHPDLIKRLQGCIPIARALYSLKPKQWLFSSNLAKSAALRFQYEDRNIEKNTRGQRRGRLAHQYLFRK
jgi:hypothetical protein